MAQELIPVTDDDHVAAAGTFERIKTKSALILEAQIDDFGKVALQPETPLPDRLNIANFMARVSSAPEQSKRGLEVGNGDTAPRIVLNILGAPTVEAVADGHVLDVLPEPVWSEADVVDGEWGL